MCYKDHVNHKSNQKNVGIIKSSNLCVEVNLYSDTEQTAVCNLASICLSKFVEEIIDYSKFKNLVVFSKQNCKYCTLAKELLKKTNISYNEIFLDNELERFEFYEKHTDEETGTIVKSMPQIFVDDHRIGGYDDLLKYINQSKKIELDYKKLGKITETIVENLNIIIDKNYYPTNEAYTSNIKHRPIGIGVQGLADVFMLLGIPFTSDKAKIVNKRIFETIYFYALKKSCELSIKHEPYSSFDGSPTSEGILQFDLWNKTPEFISIEKWDKLKDDIKRYGLRNSTLIALMPTASTAQIMGNNESFEPFTSNMYTRKVLAGEFVLINKHLVKYLRENNLYTKEIVDNLILNKGSVQSLNIPQEAKDIFKTVWEISQKSLLEMSADRAPYVCQSQSMNIFIENANPKVINSVHLYGHQLGLKTGSYYIRTKSGLQSQNFSMDYNKEKLLKNTKENALKMEEEPCLTCSS